MKKIFAIILTLCMTLGCVATVNAAGVYTFDMEVPDTVVVGETCMVEVYTKAPGLCRVRCSSSDETIATVTTFGDITGVAEGTATITVNIKFEDGTEQTRTAEIRVVSAEEKAEMDANTSTPENTIKEAVSFLDKLTEFFNMIIQMLQNLFN